MLVLSKLMGCSYLGIFTKQVSQDGYSSEHVFEQGFKLVRNVFMFTNKRLILVDKQGVTGRRAEYSSLPYKHISRFSIESAGTLDLDAELKIYMSSSTTPAVSKKFNKSIDVYQVQKFLAEKVL